MLAQTSGKDVTFFQCAVAAACQEVGDYFYLLPQQNQARRVIWNGNVNDSDGKSCRFKDFIPPEMLVKANNQEMRFELTNGSNIYVGGSDNYDNFVGGNAKGIVFSEWSLCNPLARDYFKPMINQNNGWIMYCFTPRGKNHAYDTLVNARKAANEDRWFVSLKDVSQTLKEDGTPVVTQEQIQHDIDDGMDEDTARQEYYLDFDAAVKGVIYGKALERLRAEGGVCSFDIDPQTPVQTFWDIGISVGNATAVWMMQPHKEKLRMIGYIEAEDESFEFFDRELKEYAQRHNVKFGKMYFPHDGKNREWIAGKKRHEEAIAMGYDVIVLPRITDVELGIRQTRKLFPRMVFHEVYCGVGLNHLDRYRRKIHKETLVAGSPIHDECSNCADALRQMGQFYADAHVDKRHDPIEQNKIMHQLNNPMIGNQEAYDPFSTKSTGYEDEDYDPFA